MAKQSRKYLKVEKLSPFFLSYASIVSPKIKKFYLQTAQQGVKTIVFLSCTRYIERNLEKRTSVTKNTISSFQLSGSSNLWKRILIMILSNLSSSRITLGKLCCASKSNHPFKSKNLVRRTNARRSVSKRNHLQSFSLIQRKPSCSANKTFMFSKRNYLQSFLFMRKKKSRMNTFMFCKRNHVQ